MRPDRAGVALIGGAAAEPPSFLLTQIRVQRNIRARRRFVGFAGNGLPNQASPAPMRASMGFIRPPATRPAAAQPTGSLRDAPPTVAECGNHDRRRGVAVTTRRMTATRRSLAPIPLLSSRIARLNVRESGAADIARSSTRRRGMRLDAEPAQVRDFRLLPRPASAVVCGSVQVRGSTTVPQPETRSTQSSRRSDAERAASPRTGCR